MNSCYLKVMTRHTNPNKINCASGFSSAFACMLSVTVQIAHM